VSKGLKDGRILLSGVPQNTSNGVIIDLFYESFVLISRFWVENVSHYFLSF